MNNTNALHLILKKLTLLALVLLFISLSTDLLAQCPMCRTAAESNLKAGGTSGRGLNAGILYMLSAPYILVMTLGLLWWRNQKSKGSVE